MTSVGGRLDEMNMVDTKHQGMCERGQVSTYRAWWVQSSETREMREHRVEIMTENLAGSWATRNSTSQEVCITRMVIFQQLNMGLIVSLGLGVQGQE